MDTSLLSMSKLSYERTFDDIVVMKPLLFRLHSHKSSRTSFRPEEKVIVASLYCQRLENCSSEELSHRLTARKEAPSSLTLEETSEAVEKHITSWRKQNYNPSKFISLTFNVQYVFWEWKRRMSNRRQSERPQDDDFIIIVFKGSELRASGRAKLGTELLQGKKDEHAFRFANIHEEVIVARYIPSEAILGSMSMSELEDFIPSWYKKLLEHRNEIPGSKSFRDSLPPAVDEVNCARAREALRFSLALLAPMLVPGGQHSADIGSVVGPGDIEHPSVEGVSPTVEPRSGYETVSERRAAEDGYVPIKACPGNQ
jgi:hypothetical protein